MMMRPYQVYQVKQIVDCIHEDSGNGHVWHTAGRVKTLTSFKSSALLKDNPDTKRGFRGRRKLGTIIALSPSAGSTAYLWN